MSHPSGSSSNQLAYLYAGAGACFLAGWGAHAFFVSRRSPPRAAESARPPAAPLPARPSAASSPSGNASALSTPRESTAASVSDGCLYKMAILVRNDLSQLVCCNCCSGCVRTESRCSCLYEPDRAAVCRDAAVLLCWSRTACWRSTGRSTGGGIQLALSGRTGARKSCASRRQATPFPDTASQPRRRVRAARFLLCSCETPRNLFR